MIPNMIKRRITIDCMLLYCSDTKFKGYGDHPDVMSVYFPEETLPCG